MVDMRAKTSESYVHLVEQAIIEIDEFIACLEFDMDNDANFGDSLPDDTYQLRLDCNCITDPCSQTLLDDDSDPEDGFYTIEFHALYGDADGSAVVDLSDLALLGGCWLDNAGDTGLDWNADNIVSLPDMAHFADNWRSWFTY